MGEQMLRPHVPSLKLVAPTFVGKVDPEAYLDWERRMDNIFDCYAYDEHQKIAYAAAQLTDHALTWWDRDVAERRRNHEGPVPTWEVMKFVMRRRYVPPMFHRDLQKKFRRLTQGSRSVEEYYDEFEHLRNRLQLDEAEETLMAHFLDGLHDRIARKVERQNYGGFEELLHLAIQVEQQVKRKNTSLNRSQPPGVPTWSPAASPSGQAPRPVDKPRPPAPDTRFKPRTFGPNQGNPGAKPAAAIRSRDVVCFKCQGRGHYSRECPNQRAMLLTADGDYESADEFDEEPEEKAETPEEMAYPEEGELLVIRRTLHATPDNTEESQRDNIFHTKCSVNSKVCGVIIDGGSCTNVASTYMVNKLGLGTCDHPRPYKLRWLNDKATIEVTKQVSIPFSIGQYQDQVLCDVVPMQAAHLLLGRPWQFDKAATHCGRANTYSFKHDLKRFILAPLSPKQVNEFQSKLAIKPHDKSNLLVGAKVVKRTIKASAMHVLLMVFKDVLSIGTVPDHLPEEISRLLEEFNDVFPEEIPDGLPPYRGIEHQIDLIPGAPLPNRSAYRVNPEEAKELEKQVSDLMAKGYVRESLSPCAVPVLLVPKKDGTWRMCVDCRAINSITVKYRHPIPRLDDMLDELSGANIFSKIE